MTSPSLVQWFRNNYRTLNAENYEGRSGSKFEIVERPCGAIANLQSGCVVSGHGSTPQSLHIALQLWLSVTIAFRVAVADSNDGVDYLFRRCFTAWRGFLGNPFNDLNEVI